MMERLTAANTYDPEPSWEFEMRLAAAVGVPKSSTEPVATPADR